MAGDLIGWMRMGGEVRDRTVEVRGRDTSGSGGGVMAMVMLNYNDDDMNV